jgi:hypothetical protein
MDNIMKKIKLFSVMLLVTSNAYADCYSSEGVNLCAETDYLQVDEILLKGWVQ